MIAGPLSSPGYVGRFTGHDTFPLRYMWLRKAYDAVNGTPDGESHDTFTGPVAIAKLGVGKNMAASMRHWALACGVIKKQRYGYSVADMGKYLFGEETGRDPFMEYPATTWLTHWMISGQAPPVLTTAWYFAFCNFPHSRFDQEMLVDSIKEMCVTQKHWPQISDDTILRDVKCLLRSYLAPPSEAKNVDDSIDSALAKLGLLQSTTAGLLEFNLGPKPDLPDGIFLFALHQFWNSFAPNQNMLNVDCLINESGSPGLVFKLDEFSLIERLSRIDEVSGGRFRWMKGSVVRNVLRRDSQIDKWELLDLAYPGPSCVYEVQSAVEAVRTQNPIPDFQKISQLIQMPHLVATEHYYRTGTLRWFEARIVSLSECESAVVEFDPSKGAAGIFLLTIPTGQDSDRDVREVAALVSKVAGEHPVAIGLPRNAGTFSDLCKEFTALEGVQINSPEFGDESVVKRELRARKAYVSSRLMEDLRKAFDEATWYVGDACHSPGERGPISQLASSLANETYNRAPIIRSELANRVKPSSQGQGAIRQLLNCMIAGKDREHLGIKGFGPERALYHAVLEASGLHGGKSGRVGFRSPDARHPLGKSYIAMWEAALDLLGAAADPVSLSALHGLWTAPPFGIRQGVLPVLSMTFALAQRDSIAIYCDGRLLSEIDHSIADKFLQDAGKIKLGKVDLGMKH